MSRGVGTMAAGRRRRSLRLLGAWGVFSHLLEGSRSAPHHWEMRSAAMAALLPLFCSARLAQKSDCQLLGWQRAQSCSTWLPEKRSCGADSQKLRGKEGKGTNRKKAEKREWKWVRSSQREVIAALRKRLWSLRKAVVERWRVSALLLHCFF